MKYVISDIHGCYAEFLALLREIHFSDSDELYVLGDFLDRGPEPVRLTHDLMARPNVFPLLGNHEYMALSVLRRLSVEITADNVDDYLTPEDLLSYSYWMKDGGDVTIRQYLRLDAEQREAFLEYLEECELYADLTIGGRRFVLVHAGLNDYEKHGENLEEYGPQDLLFTRPDYERKYFRDPQTTLISGHTPVQAIRYDHSTDIYRSHDNIDIDCGCCFGGALAAYCMDTDKVTYVLSETRR
ncbi:MAG: serine/threonine protein phosphatase [Firmicutes bacterium]|nr:serine/threonine protein phosphatase [Bacillota bacterium]